MTAKKRGTIGRVGALCPRSKLTEFQVAQIREIARLPNLRLSRAEVAKLFGVSKPAIQKVIWNWSWCDGDALKDPRIARGERRKQVAPLVNRWNPLTNEVTQTSCATMDGASN